MIVNETTLGAATERLPVAARAAFAMLSRLGAGRLDLTTPEGARESFNGAAPGPHAALALRDWRAVSDLLRSGDIGFAEAYAQGRWDTADLPGLLGFALANRGALEEAIYGRWWTRAFHHLRHLLRANSRAGSRRNIHAHYDLGNDFYRLWLDPGMTYSAALFEGERGRTLEAAQDAKYDRILGCLDPEPGAHVLEIGCGWGGFAERAAATRRCRVTGITLSSEQLAWGRARMARGGLEDRVELRFQDYRDLAGEYDHVASIEMFEAVGERYWPDWFGTVKRVLKPGGRAVVQTITIADGLFERYRRGADFIQEYIFPGGMLPSLRVFAEQAESAGLEVTGAHRFGRDYAETLRRWRSAFHARREAVRALGYDERFLRLWDFYLAYCEAGFDAETTDVVHIELRHA